ncbi:MAG: hypothetical protein WCI95_07265 [bacterium]
MWCSSKTGFKVLTGVGVAVVLVLAGVGTVSAFRWCQGGWARCHQVEVPLPERLTVSKLPGPPRTMDQAAFILSATNAHPMAGMDDLLQERWCDVAGNYYSSGFISSFSYERPCARDPRVLVRVEPSASTLRGRIEARGLKPNFAYQIKLRGLFADRGSFEAIGRAGRWRLPGRGTNYTDQDYEDYGEKALVEAYLFFDYFVTDRRGNAVREFALDSSLHVLWNASRQGGTPAQHDMLRVVVVPDDSTAYSRPKHRGTVEWLWAEREILRYEHADQTIRLPPRRYSAELVLTEESFHSRDNDGGFWATVYRCPITFAVVPSVAGVTVRRGFAMTSISGPISCVRFLADREFE